MNRSATIDELQAELGERLRQLRLGRDLDQLQTAEKAGVSEKALRNLESGRGSNLSTLLRVLKALDALDGLNALLPTPTVSPLALLKQAQPRQRVGRPRTPGQARKQSLE